MGELGESGPNINPDKDSTAKETPPPAYKDASGGNTGPEKHPTDKGPPPSACENVSEVEAEPNKKSAALDIGLQTLAAAAGETGTDRQASFLF